MSAAIKRQRQRNLEEDGLFESSPDHWEMLEGVRIRKYRHERGAYIYIPADLVAHLGLKAGDVVTFAIRRDVKRGSETVYLKPVDPEKAVERVSSRKILESFVSSNLDRAEIPPKKFLTIRRFLQRHPKYSMVKIHVRNYRPEYVWLEKVQEGRHNSDTGRRKWASVED